MCVFLLGQSRSSFLRVALASIRSDVITFYEFVVIFVGDRLENRVFFKDYLMING